jgi:hypothetical protein
MQVFNSIVQSHWASEESLDWFLTFHIPHRWNATHEMLHEALKYKVVLNRAPEPLASSRACTPCPPAPRPPVPLRARCWSRAASSSCRRPSHRFSSILRTHTCPTRAGLLRLRHAAQPRAQHRSAPQPQLPRPPPPPNPQAPPPDPVAGRVVEVGRRSDLGYGGAPPQLSGGPAGVGFRAGRGRSTERG